MVRAARLAKKPVLKGGTDPFLVGGDAKSHGATPPKSDHGFGAYCSRNPHSLHRWDTMMICLADFRNPTLAPSTHWAFSMPPVK
jgi:hypothetical protein